MYSTTGDGLNNNLRKKTVIQILEEECVNSVCLWCVRRMIIKMSLDFKCST